jgi:glutamate/tyrosine decarboxylase-like PLP-dependent enzyme
VPLNIVCFRWAPPSVPAERLDAINEEILVRLQEQGIAIPSGTIVDGRYAIRAANVNHRTRREDLHALVDGVVRLGPEVVASLGA